MDKQQTATEQLTAQQASLLRQISTGELVIMVGSGTGRVYVGGRNAPLGTFETTHANTFVALIRRRRVGLVREFISPRDTAHHWYEITAAGREALAAYDRYHRERALPASRSRSNAISIFK